MTQTVANWPQIDPEQVFEWLRGRVESVKERTTGSLTGLWDQYGVDEDIDTFAFLAATCSLASQSVIWTITHSALQMYADTVSDIHLTDLEPVAMPHGGCREVSPFTAYRWPQARFIKVLRQTDSLEEATRQARGVIRQLADTDVQLAYLNSSLIYFHLDPRVESYERVVAGTCDFCLKHQGEYKNGVVMPFHPNCKCVAKPKIAKAVKLKPVKSLAGKIAIPKEATSELAKTVEFMEVQARTIADDVSMAATAGESRYRIIVASMADKLGLWVYQSNGYAVMQTYLRSGWRAARQWLVGSLSDFWQFPNEVAGHVGKSIADVKRIIASMDAMMAPLSKDLVAQRVIAAEAIPEFLEMAPELLYARWQAGLVIDDLDWILTDKAYNSVSLDPLWFRQRAAGRYGSRGSPIYGTGWAVTIRIPKGTLATRLPLGPSTQPMSREHPYGAYYVTGEDELVLHRDLKYHIIKIDFGKCEILAEVVE